MGMSGFACRCVCFFFSFFLLSVLVLLISSDFSCVLPGNGLRVADILGDEGDLVVGEPLGGAAVGGQGGETLPEGRASADPRHEVGHGGGLRGVGEVGHGKLLLGHGAGGEIFLHTRFLFIVYCLLVFCLLFTHLLFIVYSFTVYLLLFTK